MHDDTAHDRLWYIMEFCLFVLLQKLTPDSFPNPLKNKLFDSDSKHFLNSECHSILVFKVKNMSNLKTKFFDFSHNPEF